MHDDIKPFASISVEYLRHTNKNPGEWIGKTADGRHIYIVVGSKGFQYQISPDVYSACLAVRQDACCLLEVKGCGVKANRAIDSKEMCKALGVDINLCKERSE